jgi:hypothetical protein
MWLPCGQVVLIELLSKMHYWATDDHASWSTCPAGNVQKTLKSNTGVWEGGGNKSWEESLVNLTYPGTLLLHSLIVVYSKKNFKATKCQFTATKRINTKI